jgi:excisionase family DNA binding protein
MTTQNHPSCLLSASQVAGLFGVDRKTVGRWADRGDLPYTRTAGGHRRFDAEVARALKAGRPAAVTLNERLARDLVAALLRTMSAADLVDALQKVRPS